MNLKVTAVGVACATVLAACGGLEKTDITPDLLMYGKLATFTVNGPNLDKGITFNAPSCAGIAEVAASAGPTEKVYTCTPAVTGPMTVAVVGGGVVLRSMTVTIPVPQVTMKTSMGDIVLELDPVKAPLSALNFMQYANANFYTNLIFHRVIPNQIVQGGGFDAALTPATGRAPIALESNKGLNNLRGTLGVARSTADNSGTSQFYINVADNPGFDYVSAAQPGYAVFGKVISGMATADAIAAVPTAVSKGMADVPVTPVVINSVIQTQ
ncbi:MAG: peptidylprolyl isomerase [Rhodoferax sp.]|jgi:cyclophilin family peptidyl-prolyl cis-trans isomerase|nr:peptidylprolyl isomerase [Rhodoferax sp.]